jgi:methionyl-tRNA synthetase
LLDLLGVAAAGRDFGALGDGREVGRIAADHRLQPGAALPPPTPIFPRYIEPEAAAP